MSENFPIVIDVEESKVGSVLRQLDAMPGVVTIHLRMAKQTPLPPLPAHRIEQPRLAPMKGSPAFIKTKKTVKALGGHSVKDIIAKSLANTPMHKDMLARVLEKNGLSGTSVNAALTKMFSDRTIERIAPGTYRLTKNGLRKYVEIKGVPQTVHGTSTAGGVVNNRRGIRALILGALFERPYEHNELKDLIASNNYAGNNLYNAVPKMREEGLVKRIDDMYEITDRGREAIAPEPEAEEAGQDHLLIEHDQHHDGETA